MVNVPVPAVAPAVMEKMQVPVVRVTEARVVEMLVASAQVIV